MAVSLLVSCGNPRPPEPPSLELPRPVRNLRATRKGEKVYLTWSVPGRTTEGESVRYLGPTRICRSLEPAIKTCGTPVGESPPPKIGGEAANRKTATPTDASYVDTLPSSSMVGRAAEFTFAIEVLNHAGRSAGLSNSVHVPAASTLPPPNSFQAQITPNGVLLSWVEEPQTPDTPEIQHEYRIYRGEQAGGNGTIIARLPLGTTQFLDQTLQWEKTYAYRATIVTNVNRQGTGSCSVDASTSDCTITTYVEGDDTPSIVVFAHDIFPPDVPYGLQAVYSGIAQQPFIDVIWSPSNASDTAGYNVYRRMDDGGEPVKINSELVKSPAYRDKNVAPGKKYSYSVSAVDLRGNQSARSQEAAETVPQPLP